MVVICLIPFELSPSGHEVCAAYKPPVRLISETIDQIINSIVETRPASTEWRKHQ